MAESKTPIAHVPKAAHSPLPWQFIPERLYNGMHIAGRGPEIWSGSDYHNRICKMADGPNEANAKFIVRAVNSHQDLLKACKVAREVLNHNPAFANGYYVKMLDAAIEKAERPAE